MKKAGHWILIIIGFTFIHGCGKAKSEMYVEVYETSAAGNSHKLLSNDASNAKAPVIALNPNDEYQKIVGIGGSFTESSANLLNQLGKENRNRILEAYFGEDGARYSLTRTHINSCDFSLSNYAYVDEGDVELSSFSVEKDRDDIIPMIKEAMAISTDGFKIISSPWTAPPWMKDNNSWVGGKLLKEHYPTWAKYFSKYIEAYKKEGIDIWAVTFENEPLGNGNNWESMHYTPEEMVDFVQNHLGPQLENDNHDVKILGYDQNRGEELKEWTEAMYRDEASSKYFAGTAVHWYASTVDWYGEALEEGHKLAPEKYLIQTEGCVDSEVPKWKDDKWYWSKEATDWGWDWAPEHQKKDHPKYVPVYRYARDIIGSLNNWVDGWVDWNMVLDRQGGPNHAKNWCTAPIIVDTAADEVYYTPLYDVMAHFSRFIAPGAVRIGWEASWAGNEVMSTAVELASGERVVVLLNQSEKPRSIALRVGDQERVIAVPGQALQTIIIEQ